VGLARDLVPAERDGRAVVGARHAVVHERAGDQLAVLAVDRALVQRLADALADAAVDLAGQQLRVDHLAEVVDDGVAQDLGLAALRVDLALAYVAAVREGRRVWREFGIAAEQAVRPLVLLPPGAGDR